MVKVLLEVVVLISLYFLNEFQSSYQDYPEV